eukprot:jgi/Botrbrau1/754/Bobra.0181s0013.1
MVLIRLKAIIIHLKMDSTPTVSNELCEEVRDKFVRFLTEYTEVEDVAPTNSEDDVPMTETRTIYLDQLQDMANNDSGTLTVDFEHLNNFDASLAEVISEHYYRMDPYLRKALQNLTAKYRPDALDVQEGLPREFWVSFVNLPSSKKLRDLTTACLGKLVCFIGTVTRTSEVRPELFLGAFRCVNCSTVVRGVEQHFKYSPPLICPGQNCGNRVHWQLLREESTFIDWQRGQSPGEPERGAGGQPAAHNGGDSAERGRGQGTPRRQGRLHGHAGGGARRGRHLRPGRAHRGPPRRTRRQGKRLRGRHRAPLSWVPGAHLPPLLPGLLLPGGGRRDWVR